VARYVNKNILLLFTFFLACNLYADSTKLVIDFESGEIPKKLKPKLPHDYSLTIQSDVVRKGQYAARFELRKGDLFINNGKPDGFRSELKDKFRAQMGKEYWYRFSMFIPIDFPIHRNRLILSQWHGVAEYELGEVSRSPVLAQRFSEGKFYITLRYSEQKVQTSNNGIKKRIYKTKDLKLGIWNDFIYHINWSYQNDGFVNVWLNGKQIVSYTGPVGYNDKEGPYFKFGIYRNDIEETYTVYYDEYRRGLNRKDITIRLL